MSNSLRTLRRSIVRGRMKAADVKKINKKGWFADNWRDPKWNYGFLKRKA